VLAYDLRLAGNSLYRYEQRTVLLRACWIELRGAVVYDCLAFEGAETGKQPYVLLSRALGRVNRAAVVLWKQQWYCGSSSGILEAAVVFWKAHSSCTSETSFVRTLHNEIHPLHIVVKRCFVKWLLPGSI
jgi:hypothetical protein